MEHTLRSYETFWQDRPHLNRVLVLQYEAFVTNPKEWVASILHWLGLFAENFAVSLNVRTGINEKYFSMWQRDRHHGFTRAWWWLSGFERKLPALEQRTRTFGYSLIHPEERLPLSE